LFWFCLIELLCRGHLFDQGTLRDPRERAVTSEFLATVPVTKLLTLSPEDRSTLTILAIRTPHINSAKEPYVLRDSGMFAVSEITYKDNSACPQAFLLC
jgi:hypothetical protein